MLWFQIGYMVIYVGPADATPDLAPDPLARAYKLALLAVSAVLIASHAALARALSRRLNAFFWAFLVLAAASLAWSIDQPVTATRLVALASVVAVCFAFGVGAWNRRRLQDVVRPAITVILLASLLVGLFDPSLVKEAGNTISLKNAWRGLTSQKNLFGELATFGVIFWVHGWLAREVRGSVALLGTALAVGCLILSRSSTSWFAAAFTAAFIFILMRSAHVSRRYLAVVVGVFAAICVTYGIALMNVVPGLEKFVFDPVTALTGKNLTFSGRTVIWRIIGRNIARHLLAGSGYAAYWGAGPVPSSPSYAFVVWGFWPTESHNGYLEILNDLGILGLACLLGYLSVYLRQAVRLFRVDRSQATLFLALLFYQALLNLSESTWLDLDNFCFTIMTVATVLLARAEVEYRRGRYAASGARAGSGTVLRRAPRAGPPGAALHGVFSRLVRTHSGDPG